MSGNCHQSRPLLNWGGIGGVFDPDFEGKPFRDDGLVSYIVVAISYNLRISSVVQDVSKRLILYLLLSVNSHHPGMTISISAYYFSLCAVPLRDTQIPSVNFLCPFIQRKSISKLLIHYDMMFHDSIHHTYTSISWWTVLMPQIFPGESAHKTE